MFKLDSEEALLAAFRPKDREAVQLAPRTRFPLAVRHYLAWTHPGGGRVYLVFALPPGKPIGLVFEGNGSAPAVPSMCDWCHSHGLGTQVGLLTTYVNTQKRAGILVCSDLSCKQKLEDEADRSGTSALPAIHKLLGRMGRFAEQALKIDLLGRDR